MKKRFLAVLCALFLVPVRLYAAEEAVVPAEWTKWLETLKQEMVSRGISRRTIQKAYGNNSYYHKRSAAVEKDNRQAEFILTAQNYLRRRITPARVKEARRHYRKLQKQYPDLERQYHVPLNYLTAFWALESDFGRDKGNFNLIDSLTNLSYRNRRSTFFKNELYNVLKIMETYNLDNNKISGSWAGAMGHFQFMPSTFNTYAIDYNRDGTIDIWDSLDDAIGSAANMLGSLGWKRSETWGMAILLPWNFDYRLAGLENIRTAAQWHKLGIRLKNGKKLPVPPSAKGAVIVPDGKYGESYFVMSNFRKIMIWNRAASYALAVGILADCIKTDGNCSVAANPRHYPLTDRDIKEIQAFANKYFKSGLQEDGRLGSRTKAAVRKLQAAAGLSQDGYPDYSLLGKIRRYNPQTGFAVPVQPPKPRNKAKGNR